MVSKRASKRARVWLTRFTRSLCILTVSYNRNEATTSTNNSSISVIAEGKQGFGRDSSMAYYHRRHDNNNNNNNSDINDNDLLFISLLDLQGIDTPETQVAKFAIFERISSSTQEEEIIQEESESVYIPESYQTSDNEDNIDKTSKDFTENEDLLHIEL